MNEINSLGDVLAWVVETWPGAERWIVPAGALLACILLLVLWLQFRRRSVSTVGRTITTPLVLAWEAQGLHHLAEVTGAKGVAAWVLAGVTSAVLITLAAFADDHYKVHSNLGWPGRLVWIVAVPMGLVVALTAKTPAEFSLRIILPLLVALVWWVPYAPPIVRQAIADGVTATRDGAWRITPRRIGVALGLIDPTDSDLNTVHEERQVRRLTTAAHKLHHGRRWLRPIRAAKLRRLGLVATPAMVNEVARRVSLVHEIETLTAPVQTRAPQTDDARAASAPTDDARADDARAEDPRVAAPKAESARADESAPRINARADESAPRINARAETPRVAAPKAESARASKPGDARAERAERAYAQYAERVEKEGTEPDGAGCAELLGVTHPGNGRTARGKWRLRFADEVKNGKRAYPARLPADIAVLLPAQMRTRAPQVTNARASESAPNTDARVDGSAPDNDARVAQTTNARASQSAPDTDARVDGSAPDNEARASESAPSNDARVDGSAPDNVRAFPLVGEQSQRVPA